ncbi:MAG TPA: GMC family oxidoreductase [Longimicrobiales bacterium]
MQARRSRPVYDVVIAGSGAGGGMAAMVLTQAGARVALLEAGQLWNSARDSAMLTWPYESPRRGAPVKWNPWSEFDGCIGGWSIEGEPYTTAPGENFLWWRARMLGGRTNHWGRISLRFGPDDFRRKTLDGLGDDWPITYNDVGPYYDRVDRLIGIFGSKEGLPNEPDGIFQPPPRPRCHELMVKQAADRLGITCIPARLSILTQPLHGRPACHYCGQCGRGCMTHSNFSVPGVLLPPAEKTGRLTTVPFAMVREVTMGKDGRANGVSYIDKKTGRDEHIRARVVVLAASACESTRILFNSHVANSSGVLGKYLTDTTGTYVSGYFPQMENSIPHNEDGVGGMHLYMPWWLDNRKLDFPRGYHIEFGGGRHLPGYGFMGGIDSLPGGGGWGHDLKGQCRRFYGATIGFSGRGEMIPNEHSYCEVDPDVTDKYGIPVLRFHWQWSDYEYKQVKHMQETFRQLITELGGSPLSAMPTQEKGYGISRGGEIIHEAGTTRMGADARTSVVNGYCQSHDVKNLFVVDAGPFTTNADKNITWTILALAWRSSDYIADQMKQQAL